MKKLIFLSFFGLGLILSGSGQTNMMTVLDSSKMTNTRWRDTCFALLNLTSAQVPSGILTDYSLMPFNDSNFNSQISANIDTMASSSNFFTLHDILYNSIVNSNGNSIGSTDSLYTNAYRYQRNTGSIPLIFMFTPFQKIKSTAYAQGQLTFTADSLRLKDVSGRSASPYANDFAFAFAPFTTTISQYNAISFSAPSQFWQMPGVTSVLVDFGDGAGFRTLTPNSTVSINYGASGTYLMVAQITTSNGVFTAKSQLHFTLPSFYISADSTWTFSVAPLYTSISNYINSGGARQGQVMPLGSVSSCSDGNIFSQLNCDINPGAIVTISNGCDRVFDKPIIVVEGLDLNNGTDEKPVQQRYQYLQSMFLYSASITPAYYSSMRALGYDFVFVVFTKNQDFIENNAMVLEQVIEKVNRVKSGTNKDIVIGYSMGGLVARYALRDMENQGIAHQVSTYFSYDAPHQGANVPLGFQIFFTELLKDMPELKWLKAISSLVGSYSSPAVQELLVTYADFSSGDLNNNPLAPVRSIFAQRLLTLGYPQTTTNIAISNGRGNNTSGTTNAGNGAQWNNMSPGSEIFKGGFNYVLEYMYSEIYTAIPNSLATILKYHFSGLKPVRLFFSPLSLWVIRNVTIKYVATNPYDDAPGGYEATQSQFVYDLGQHSTATFWNHGPSITFYFDGGSTPPVNLGHFGHNFVPVASALDLQNQSYGSSNAYQSGNLYYGIDASMQNIGQVTGNTLSPTTLSPFKYVHTYTSDCGSGNCLSETDDGTLVVNNYTVPLIEGSNWNYWHGGTITNQSNLFLLRKSLNTNTFSSCTFGNQLCSTSPTISGPSAFCTTATYTIGSANVSGLNIQWSFPNGTTSIVSGQGTPTVNVTKIGDGYETAIVKLTGDCGSASYTYLNGVNNIAVGSPNNLTGTYTLNGNTYPLQTYNSVAVGSIAGNFSWPNVTNISIGHSGTGNWSFGSSNMFGFYLASGQNMYLTFSGTGFCGTVQATRTFQQSGGFMIVASPNPTSDLLNVSITSIVDTSKSQITKQATTSLPNTTQISLYDVNSGALIKQWTYQEADNSNYKLNTNSIKTGVYVLKVARGNTTATTKVLVQK